MDKEKLLRVFDSDSEIRDKCIWKRIYNNQFYYDTVCSHSKHTCFIPNGSKWNYCPYCGKEIDFKD